MRENHIFVEAEGYTIQRHVFLCKLFTGSYISAHKFVQCFYRRLGQFKGPHTP